MTAQFHRLLAAAMIPFIIMVSAPAMAQESSTSSAKRQYDVAYFDQFAPQNALDMVERVPGFQIRGGNNSRGLGQGGANVLINGIPIVSKGGSALDQIARIPVGNVKKIEVLDGATLDIPGFTGEVANILTEAGAKISGTWEWRPEWRQHREPNLLRGNVRASGETGNLSWGAELRYQSENDGNLGTETRSLADGTLFETRTFDRNSTERSPGVSVNLTWKPKADQIGNLNGTFNLFDFESKNLEPRMAVTDAGTTGVQTLTQEEDEWNFNVDGDYTFPVFDGRLKVIGLLSMEHSPTINRFSDLDATGSLIADTEFNQTADEGEAIAKVEYSWSPRKGRDWQVSLEGAHNFLDIENQFSDFLNDDIGTPDLLEISENRVEGFITHTRRLGEKWSVQAALGAEFSELSAGTTTNKFFRPKGSVTTTFKADDSLTVTTRIAREVGQLNFFDFSSSVSLDEDIDTRGTNLNLIPSQTWRGEVTVNKRFEGGHSLEAEVTGRIVNDIVDRIAIADDNGDTTTGVGNIGTGQRITASISGTLKGEPFGLNGMELRGSSRWSQSYVTDPFTFQTRQFTRRPISEWDFNFRHDIPKTDLAWGFNFGTFELASRFNPFDISRFDRRPGRSGVFAEHKDIVGLKVRASLNAVLGEENFFDRIVFDDVRGGGQIDRIDNVRRPSDGPFFILQVSDTF